MTDPFIHYPTALDWIEHLLAFGGAMWIGWWLRDWWERR